MASNGDTPTQKPLTLRLPEGVVVERTPDSSFGHLSQEFPSVIVEVSSSEKRKDLSRLASEYIRGSRGAVRVVVGLDIENRGDDNKKATISVWRPRAEDIGHPGVEVRVMQEVNCEPFRDSEGNTVPSGKLSLSLSDFAPVEYFNNISDPPPTVDISYARLASFLEGAEREREEEKEKESELVGGENGVGRV